MATNTHQIRQAVYENQGSPVKSNDDILFTVLGFIGTIIFHGILVFLLFYFVFTTPTHLNPTHEPPQGIMVDFGDADIGFGNIEPSYSDAAIVQTEKSTSTSSDSEEFLTQDNDSFAVDDNTSLNPNPDPTPTPDPDPKPDLTPTPTPNPKPEQVKTEETTPTPDPRSLFPGRNDSQSTATSQGEESGPGNQGTKTGEPGVHVYAGGIHIGGGLEGRGYEGKLPLPNLPNIQEQNTVIVTVRVDSRGNVTSATPGAKGTTTLNETLLNAAAKAARDTKFKANPNQLEQVGTITYIFKPK